MSFRVEVVCDVQTATIRSSDGPCHSLSGMKPRGEAPVGEAVTWQEAQGKAKRLAQERGWIRKARAGRSTIYVCPACRAVTES